MSVNVGPVKQSDILESTDSRQHMHHPILPPLTFASTRALHEEVSRFIQGVSS